jgi:two-component system response regulator GlrR
MNTPTRICAVDLSNDLKPSLKKTIETNCNLVIDILKSNDELKTYFKKSRPELILMFLDFLDSTTKNIITQFKRHYDDFSLLCILSVKDHEELDELMMMGIDDFIVKPFLEPELLARIRRKMDSSYNTAIDNSGEYLKEKYGISKLIGEDPSFVKVLQRLRLIARINAPVLLLGETGTGKELFASAIHFLSSRKRGPFIPVNCGTIPVQLFENELFGHTEGAYTDAKKFQKGYVAEAEGGTLFLDEVDSILPAAQVKLLRFLQERQYKPLGGSNHKTADVRIIAASNIDLLNPKAKEHFRKDLLYRLSVFSVTIPPLRDRKSDIPKLTDHFLKKYSEFFNVSKKRLSKAAIEKLMCYDWPGNIRELENVIQQCLVMSKSPTIEPNDLSIQKKLDVDVVDGNSFQEMKASIIEKFERNYVIKLLSDSQGNITRAAKLAKMPRKSLYRLMNKHDISPKVLISKNNTKKAAAFNS